MAVADTNAQKEMEERREKPLKFGGKILQERMGLLHVFKSYWM